MHIRYHHREAGGIFMSIWWRIYKGHSPESSEGWGWRSILCAGWYDVSGVGKNFIQGDKSDLQEISEKGVTESGITNKRIPKVDSYKINRKVIDSSEYKKKFNGITKKSRVDEAIYKYAKAALYHRDGTNM